MFLFYSTICYSWVGRDPVKKEGSYPLWRRREHRNRKAKPSALQNSAAPLILMSYVTEAAWPRVAAPPAPVSFFRGCVMVTSKAASLLPHLCRRRMSAGRLLLP